MSKRRVQSWREAGYTFFVALFLMTCNTTGNRSEAGKNLLLVQKPVAILSYSLIHSFPHDTTAFTEGLVFHHHELYESTGAPDNLPQTKSLFGSVDLKTSKIKVKAMLDRNQYFGEGIAFLNGKVYQLTYKTKVGFIYDATTFKKLKAFTFLNKEGWGLTTDGKNLIMSDGSNALTYWDPENLQVVKTIPVSENGYAEDYLNELEFINGYIYANLWTTNTIVKIDPMTGMVIAKLDLSALAEDSKTIFPGSLEMNGIAYDSISNLVYVTGKLWPKVYEIKIKGISNNPTL